MSWSFTRVTSFVTVMFAYIVYPTSAFARLLLHQASRHRCLTVCVNHVCIHLYLKPTFLKRRMNDELIDPSIHPLDAWTNPTAVFQRRVRG